MLRTMMSSATAALLLVPTLALAATEVAAPELVRKVPDGPPSMMTNAAIAEHNRELDSKHPDFIKCRRIDVIGSLAKKARVCRTNEGWAESWKNGNTTVREAADHYAPKLQDCRINGTC